MLSAVCLLQLTNTQRNKATSEMTPQNQEQKKKKNEINHNTQKLRKKKKGKTKSCIE
jgi:hypothetical protein